MGVYTVEMAYGLGLSVSVSAENKEDAIRKAVKLADEMVIVEGLSVDIGCREMEEITGVHEQCGGQ